MKKTTKRKTPAKRAKKKPASQLSNLLRDFEPDAPQWARRVPLWIWGLLAVALGFAVQTIPAWLSLPLPDGKLIGIADPDPWLRLTIVRDWLTGGSWYSHVMLHSNAPWGGISTPWTRPLDMVIAVLVWLQFHSAPLNVELIRAALLVPDIMMLLLIGGLLRANHVLKAAPVATFLSIALVVTMPIIWNYFGEAYADHHSFLAALFVWALVPHLMRNPSKAAIAMSGLILALMLWISVEAMMLIAVMFLFLGLAWLLDDAVGRRLPFFAMATAVGAWVAVFIERPFADWLTPIYDSVSVVHAYVLTMCAAAGWLLSIFSPKLPDIRQRLAFATAVFVILLLNIWRVLPLFFHGPMATVDPYIFSDFLPRINEAQPLSSRSWYYVIAVLAQPVAAILICLTQLRSKAPIYTPAVSSLLLLLIVMTTSLYFVELRWFYYLYPVVAIALAPWLAALYTPNYSGVASRQPAKWINGLSLEEQLARRLPILAAIFLLPIGMFCLVPDSDTNTSRRIDRCQKEARLLIYGGKLEQMLGPKPLILLAPTDLGGEMLFWTKERIVASNYHREGSGIRYVWGANDVAREPAMRHYLARRGVQALLVCPSSTDAEDSYLAALQAGKHRPPAWLKPLPFTSDAPRDAKPAIFLVR